MTQDLGCLLNRTETGQIRVSASRFAWALVCFPRTSTVGGGGDLRGVP